MKKIQVTNVHIDSRAQVIVPNTYFVTKAVKALLACDALKDAAEDSRFRNEQSYPILKEKTETIGTFLQELIDALEGDEE